MEADFVLTSQAIYTLAALLICAIVFLLYTLWNFRYNKQCGTCKHFRRFMDCNTVGHCNRNNGETVVVWNVCGKYTRNKE